MKIRLIAIALTMLMILSGVAVLFTYTPSNVNEIGNRISPDTATQTTDQTWIYPISLTFNQKTNASQTTDVYITMNVSQSQGKILQYFNNTVFVGVYGVSIPSYIISGTNNTTFTAIVQTQFENSTIYLYVLPTSISELGSNTFLAPDVYGNPTYANLPSSFFKYYYDGGNSAQSTDATLITASTNNVDGTPIDFYVSSTNSGINKVFFEYSYTGFQYVVNNAGNLALYDTAMFNGFNNVSYGLYGSPMNNQPDSTILYGIMANSAPYDSVQYGLNTTTGTLYSNGVSSVLSGSQVNGELHAMTFINSKTMEYMNGTYVKWLNNTDATPTSSVYSINSYISTADSGVYPSVNVNFLYAMTYHPYVYSIGTQRIFGSTTSTSSGNYILFNETGLPYGQSWNVSLTNRTANVVNSVYASTTQTAKVFLPTGYNYSFSFSTLDKSYYKIVNLTGNVYLSPKANATVNITLTNVSYDVVFHESGLLSGNAWGIKFNGTDYNTTSASLTFIEKNGSYPFTVIISKLYNSNVSSGYANVSGQSLNFYIGFTYHAFNITFSEVGLPSDVQWSMTINGTVYYSNVSDSNILLFQGKAGSYDGIVNNASYYTPVTKYFNFTISGNAQYTIDYGIILTFIESGYNGLWHITINGVTYSSSTNTIVATVSPGQVVFNVWGISGYTINPEVVTQSYTSAQTIRVAFTVQPASFENILISTPMVILYFVLAIMTMAGVVYWRLKHER